MKNQILIGIFLVLLFSSCKQENENKKTSDEATTIQEEVIKVAKKNVQNKTPLNKQELEDTFPIRIGDFERDFLEVSEDMATSEGAFGNGKIYLKIADSAGPLGNSLITMYNAIYDLKEEDSPTVTWQKKLRNNIKTINRYETDTQNASIEFIYVDRFHMLLTGKKITTDELWNLFEFDNYISSLQVLDDFDNKNIDRNH